MFNKEKDYTSAILLYFLEQNRFITMYYYLSPITSQNKIALIHLFLIK